MQKEYSILFNAITDAINILAAAQQEAEELFISKPSPVIHVLSSTTDQS